MRSRSASVIAAHKDAPGSIAATKAAAQVAVPETQTTSRSDWLDGYRDELVRGNAAIRAIDLQKIEFDKRARALEVKWIKRYLRHRQRLIKKLDKRGIAEKDWCRTLGRGFSYSTVMRRIQLLKGLDHYLRRRAEVGDNGCYGLEYAVYLARPEKPESETSSRPTRPPIVYATSDPDPDPDHQFFTGGTRRTPQDVAGIGTSLRHQPAVLSRPPPL
jgi:hypothetical protein